MTELALKEGLSVDDLTEEEQEVYRTARSAAEEGMAMGGRGTAEHLVGYTVGAEEAHSGPARLGLKHALNPGKALLSQGGSPAEEFLSFGSRNDFPSEEFRKTYQALRNQGVGKEEAREITRRNTGEPDIAHGLAQLVQGMEFEPGQVSREYIDDTGIAGLESPQDEYDLNIPYK